MGVTFTRYFLLQRETDRQKPLATLFCHNKKRSKVNDESSLARRVASICACCNPSSTATNTPRPLALAKKTRKSLSDLDNTRRVLGAQELHEPKASAPVLRHGLLLVRAAYSPLGSNLDHWDVHLDIGICRSVPRLGYINGDAHTMSVASYSERSESLFVCHGLCIWLL